MLTPTRIILAALMLVACSANAQTGRQPDAAQIKLGLKRLNTLGSVLYLAAHPDDENTRAIAYLVNDRYITTGYLSLTRGDGGQNLIGPEIRDLLGLIRTQELLSARRIDGGQQFFTRANDFGYSKTAKETFTLWSKKEVLNDVVKVIRQFKPDVILTRFPPDERAGHGQHTASAMLALEAFDAAADGNAFPDQVRESGTWQVKRVLINTGRWWNQTITEKTPGILTLNVGAYSSLLGKSSSEIAAESRTQHKSQGFGSPGRRGDALEFFEQAKGEKAEKDIFEGVNLSWTRLPGGEHVKPLVEKALREFNEDDPAASVPALLQIRQEISLLPESVWRTRKWAEVNQLIEACLGLFIEVTADQYWVAPGEKLVSTFEVINRSYANVKLTNIRAVDLTMDTVLQENLKDNVPLNFKSLRTLSSGKPYSGAYWLKEQHTQGLFTVSNAAMIGQPENDPAVQYEFAFQVYGEVLKLSRPLIYKWTDPVKGELSRPFEVSPPVLLNLSEKVFVFPDRRPQDIPVLVKSSSERKLNGSVRLSLPEGWTSVPESIPFTLGQRGEEVLLRFSITPGKAEVTSSIGAMATVDQSELDWSVQVIHYDHIPTQTLFPKAEARVVRLDLKKEGQRIGYIRGAGDEIPASLKNMGYQVWEMKDEEVTPENLKKLDAVVLGIRALNTNTRIRHYMDDLLEYVKEGGTLISQYNTNGTMEIDPARISPFPLSLSRDRVTEENSDVQILKPEHPALSFPNKISAKDFEGWVQERGLYFPDKWDSQFQALLSLHDEGETPKLGSLLIANYGKGHYVYTGLSFFRELPEGVPGAYRLFANLVSLGKHNNAKLGKK